MEIIVSQKLELKHRSLWLPSICGLPQLAGLVSRPFFHFFPYLTMETDCVTRAIKVRRDNRNTENGASNKENKSL